MTERTASKIEVHYHIKEAEHIAHFQQAAAEYVEAQDEELDAYAILEQRKKHALLRVGQLVPYEFSYAGVDHQADLLHDSIDAILATSGLAVIAKQSYAGQELSGPLPEQE